MSLSVVSARNRRGTLHLIVAPTGDAETMICGTDVIESVVAFPGPEEWRTPDRRFCCGHCMRILAELRRQIEVVVT